MVLKIGLPVISGLNQFNQFQASVLFLYPQYSLSIPGNLWFLTFSMWKYFTQRSSSYKKKTITETDLFDSFTDGIKPITLGK